MRSFRSDPYLWIHLAGLAALPIFAELCLVGFAISDPLLPTSVELLLVAIIGIAPILWMQWQRPFYIFSLVAIALKPEQLTEDQLRLLTLFKSVRNRILAILVPVLLVLGLRQAYYTSAIVSEALPFADSWRIAGLLLAAIGFLGCNLFLQVPVSVASVMLTSQSAFESTAVYPIAKVRQDFTLLGLQINQILPPLLLPASPTPEARFRSEPELSEPEDTEAPVTDAAAVVLPSTGPQIQDLNPVQGDLETDDLEAEPNASEFIKSAAEATPVPVEPSIDETATTTASATGDSEVVAATEAAPDPAAPLIDETVIETESAANEFEGMEAEAEPEPNESELAGATDVPPDAAAPSIDESNIAVEAEPILEPSILEPDAAAVTPSEEAPIHENPSEQ